MKLISDPMAILRLNARDLVDNYFNSIHSTHKEAARTAKRVAASQFVINIDHSGGVKTVPSSLDHEAALRGLSTYGLAQLILSKPDEVQQREDRRQSLFAAIERAATPQELDAITSRLASI